MHVYSLDADSEKYQSLVLEREGDWAGLLDQFDGRPIGSNWQPVSVTIFREEGRGDLPQSDFPNLGGIIPVFSERAVKALGSLLSENGELLPVRCEEGKYFAFNVTRVIDALDLKQSELEFFPNSNRIMFADRYVFKPERLHGATVFKIPQLPGGYTFNTDEFVARVKEARLVGFCFRELWREETAQR